MPEARHRWQVAVGQRLNRREWDGEAVLFNDLSGATHLLSSTAVWLLERLAEAPDAIPGLAAALKSALAAEIAEDRDNGVNSARGDEAGETSVDHAQLAALLADLHALDLIEPC